MSAEQRFFEAASASPAVTALATRVYPDIASEDAQLPLVVYERRATDAVETIHGGPPVAACVTIAASAWAKTRLAAEQLGDALVAALGDAATLVNRFGHFDAEREAYCAAMDFEIWET